MVARLFFSLFAFVIVFSSCTLNREYMFRTDEDYVFDVPVIDSSSVEYRITSTDIISFDLYTNNGALMLEFTTSGSETPKYGTSTTFNFTVDSQGFVEFPVIGRRFIRGMTVAQVQDFLEAEYVSQFNSPYAIVKVLNRRAVVFTAPAGNGQVIPLLNQGINVIEAIALAGGGGKNGDVSQIKLIRKIGTEQKVYHIDLSHIDGIKYTNMAVEAGDIIYIPQTPQVGREIVQDIQPFVTIISGLALIYAIFLRTF